MQPGGSDLSVSRLIDGTCSGWSGSSLGTCNVIHFTVLKICVSLQRPDVIVGCLKYWNELEETLRVWNSMWFYMWNQQNKKARIIFRQFSLKTCCGYSLESPCRGDSNEYPQHTFLWRNKQNYPLIITKYPPYLFHCVWCLFWLGFQAFMVIVNVPLICWLDRFYKQWKVRWPY